MFTYVAFAFWFLLPAAIANAAPVLAALLPYVRNWSQPMDFGYMWRGKRLLGPHKTWRGFISGVLTATLIFWLQQVCVRHFGWAAHLVDGTGYAALPFVLGPLFGVGALGGDAVKSFFKRLHGVEAGRHWIPFDQLDYIIGAMLISLPFIVLPVMAYAWMLVIWFGAHMLANYIGWRLGIREQPI
jgi:CDP-2,3-bis-(O-geranylgeranyl)-sn-glycerol synthase